jgi:hypothetical protein
MLDLEHQVSKHVKTRVVTEQEFDRLSCPEQGVPIKTKTIYLVKHVPVQPPPAAKMGKSERQWRIYNQVLQNHRRAPGPNNRMQTLNTLTWSEVQTA